MKIYKVTTKTCYSRPTYIVCDTLSDVERLFQKIYGGISMDNVELVSEDVINMWAQ